MNNINNIGIDFMLPGDFAQGYSKDSFKNE